MIRTITAPKEKTMFNFGKKDDDEDPQKALNKARGVVNDGLMGG
jgi:hypothetical protein